MLLEGFKETIEIGVEKDTNQNLKRRATFLTPIDLILKRYGTLGSGFQLLIFDPAQSF